MGRRTEEFGSSVLVRCLHMRKSGPVPGVAAGRAETVVNPNVNQFTSMVCAARAVERETRGNTSRAPYLINLTAYPLHIFLINIIFLPPLHQVYIRYTFSNYKLTAQSMEARIF